MKTIETKKGYYMRFNGTDCFIETSQTRKTDKLALNFINALQNKTNLFFSITNEDIALIKSKMLPCTYTLLYSEKWKQKVYDFEGENFMYGGFESEYKLLPLIV